MPIKKVEHLNKQAAGTRAFYAAFKSEYLLFDTYARNLATNRASYSSKLIDMFGIGGIGAGTAGLNTVIAVLAGLSIISGVLSIILGFVAAVVGIASNIGFTIYRNRVNEKRYTDAVKFIETNMHKKINRIRSKIAHQFSDYLNHCSKEEAHTFAKKTFRVIADSIVSRRVQNLDEFISPAFMEEYQKLIPGRKLFAKFSVINILMRLRQNIVDAWRNRKSQQTTVASPAKVGLFKQPSKSTLPKRPNYPAPEVKQKLAKETIRPRM